jgi:hypothetical protein
LVQQIAVVGFSETPSDRLDIVILPNPRKCRLEVRVPAAAPPSIDACNEKAVVSRHYQRGEV